MGFLHLSGIQSKEFNILNHGKDNEKKTFSFQRTHTNSQLKKSNLGRGTINLLCVETLQYKTHSCHFSFFLFLMLLLPPTSMFLQFMRHIFFYFN